MTFLKVRNKRFRPSITHKTVSFSLVSPGWGTPHGVWWPRTRRSAPEASQRYAEDTATVQACHPDAGEKTTANGEKQNWFSLPAWRGTVHGEKWCRLGADVCSNLPLTDRWVYYRHLDAPKLDLLILWKRDTMLMMCWWRPGLQLWPLLHNKRKIIRFCEWPNQLEQIPQAVWAAWRRTAGSAGFQGAAWWSPAVAQWNPFQTVCWEEPQHKLTKKNTLLHKEKKRDKCYDVQGIKHFFAVVTITPRCIGS